MGPKRRAKAYRGKAPATAKKYGKKCASSRLIWPQISHKQSKSAPAIYLGDTNPTINRGDDIQQADKISGQMLLVLRVCC
jgi:hypothetical protein